MAVLDQFKFNPLSPKSNQHQFLLVISMLFVKQSGHENYGHHQGRYTILIDISTNSPHYFY